VAGWNGDRASVLIANRQSADEPFDHTTAASLVEKAKLKRHFGRFDMFFVLICTLVGLDTLGAVASDGAQAFAARLQ
jgi:hypothetical protein